MLAKSLQEKKIPANGKRICKAVSIKLYTMSLFFCNVLVSEFILSCATGCCAVANYKCIAVNFPNLKAWLWSRYLPINNSTENSNVEANLDGRSHSCLWEKVVYLSGWVFLCKRCFNSVTDVVLCVEETLQCELAEKHHRHQLLVRAQLGYSMGCGGNSNTSSVCLEY